MAPLYCMQTTCQNYLSKLSNGNVDNTHSFPCRTCSHTTGLPQGLYLDAGISLARISTKAPSELHRVTQYQLKIAWAFLSCFLLFPKILKTFLETEKCFFSRENLSVFSSA